ncbi:MAG: glycosyltransferase family 2 protein [Alphaproteobacteria bacterium]
MMPKRYHNLPKHKTKPSRLVSVVMPVFNAALYLRYAIESVLAQTMHDFELLIIDDASSDNSYDIAKFYQAKDKRIKIIRNKKNLGDAGARQVGVAQAVGQYILWQDADDESAAERLQILLEHIEKNHHLSAIGSGFYIKRGKKIKIAKPPTALIDKNKKNFSCHFPTLLVRKSIYQKISYRPLPSGSDSDWCYRLLEKNGIIKNLPQPLYYYRKHRHGITRAYFKKFIFGMMVRLSVEARQKNLPDPLDTHHTITLDDFQKFYHPSLYGAIKKNIADEIGWFLLEQMRSMVIRPWLFYRYLSAWLRFFFLAGQRHFFLAVWVFISRCLINFLPYIILRKTIL